MSYVSLDACLVLCLSNVFISVLISVLYLCCLYLMLCWLVGVFCIFFISFLYLFRICFVSVSLSASLVFVLYLFSICLYLFCIFFVSVLHLLFVIKNIFMFSPTVIGVVLHRLGLKYNFKKVKYHGCCTWLFFTVGLHFKTFKKNVGLHCRKCTNREIPRK